MPATAVLVSLALAAAGHRHVLPPVSAPGVQQATTDGGGTRVAAFVEIDGDAPPLALEARGVDGARSSAWAPLVETHHGAGARVAILDLDRTWPAAELRSVDGGARVRTIRWELLTPAFPLAGALARAKDPASEPVYALPDVLAPLEITSREAWGARASGCTTLEDDWTRMAIHHTAEQQEIGGSVAEVVRGLQAYAQDSGEYCDIPYQFLVGYDGSLWEARGLEHTSGATGGGNNPGNLAVSFMGCYHPEPACPVSHPVPEIMFQRGRLLVQSLRKLEDIASDADTIRGHRDWPGNATACPGDFIHARLDEIRTDLAWYAGEPRFPDYEIEVKVGEPTSIGIAVLNTGGLTWEPGIVFLGTTAPRDAPSPLGAMWANPARAATVDVSTPPGEMGAFALSVVAPALGDYELHLNLVADGVTWFADAPWGGGPSDDVIALRFKATADGPPIDDEPAGGCGCQVGAAPGARWPGALPLMVSMAWLGIWLARRLLSRRPCASPRSPSSSP